MSKFLVIFDTKYHPISISKNWYQECWNRLPEHLLANKNNFDALYRLLAKQNIGVGGLPTMKVVGVAAGNFHDEP